MKIGVDYYPEHWDRELWEADASLMASTGVEVVRLAEFAWSRLEPREGEFDFSWLDEAIELFASKGMEVVLCTPTNCPPLWLYEKYPDAVQTGRDGRKIAIGIRGHRCYNDPDFLRLADRIIDRLTDRYKDNKAVAAWQIDNELEANFCFCKTCIDRYRAWLKGRYQSLDNINKAYKNNVWSGGYSSWMQVNPPFGSYNYAWYNPAFMLDFNRFASDDAIEYIKRQRDIIRKNCPDTKITTNTWFCENMIDFYKEFSELDFVSYDNYPTTKIPENPEECYSHAFHLDLMRGIKKKNFWVMEQLSGGMGSWAPMSRTPSPGMIKGYSLQAFAHGADTVVHFRWRTAVGGAEMHWHGLIDHSNVPSRRLFEFKELCETAKTLKGLRGSEIKSEAAILYSADSENAFKIQPQTDGMYYLEQLKLLHNAFLKHGVNVDIISEKDSFEGYKVIAAPELYIADKSAAKRLYAAAEGGASVILTNRCGVKDENNNCVMSPLPTVFRELVGAYVEEYDPIGYDSVNVRFSDGEIFKAKQWCDIIKPETAEPVAFYDGEYFKGECAVAKNNVGKGTAFYIGTVGEKKLYHKIVKEALILSGTDFVEGIPDGIEITTRESEAQKARFIFNNTDKEMTFELFGEKLSFKPFEMKIQEY